MEARASTSMHRPLSTPVAYLRGRPHGPGLSDEGTNAASRRMTRIQESKGGRVGGLQQQSPSRAAYPSCYAHLHEAVEASRCHQHERNASPRSVRTRNLIPARRPHHSPLNSILQVHRSTQQLRARRRHCGSLVSPPRDAAAALWLVQCCFTDACRIEAKLGALRPMDD